ncbi:MAG: class II aldolase/adducin family protein [Candidatus Cloacimonetes bacterium]|nr:class II aldolase/adducin family protein [Candidatus Cloacimonadota bacterium]
MTEIEIREQIISAGKRMYEKNFGASNDGNISGRLNDDQIIITPSGVSKGFMKPEDLIIVNMQGEFVAGKHKPSSELFMHLKVYQSRPDVYGICHAHPAYATAFAVANISLDKPFLQEVVLTLGKIPVVEYGTTGTEDLYKPLLKYLTDHDAFLLANHGALTVGKDVLDSYYKMETVEHSAKIYYLAKQLGHINLISEKDVEKLKQIRLGKNIK